MSIRNEKTEVINIRVSKEEKSQLIKMAHEKHLNLSSFIMTTLLSKNKNDIIYDSPIILNDNQFNKLLTLMKNPPEPNDNLKKVLAWRNIQLKDSKKNH